MCRDATHLCRRRRCTPTTTSSRDVKVKHNVTQTSYLQGKVECITLYTLLPPLSLPVSPLSACETPFLCRKKFSLCTAPVQGADSVHAEQVELGVSQVMNRPL